MAIRLRKINNKVVALCAAETDPAEGDIYLDDEAHYALAAKFAADWQGQTVDWKYEDIWKLMESQKIRDAKEEIEKWIKEEDKIAMETPYPWKTKINLMKKLFEKS